MYKFLTYNGNINTNFIFEFPCKEFPFPFNGLCIQLFAELNAFMRGVKHRFFFRGNKSVSTKWRAFRLIRDKDTPFGYADTKFQTSTLNHGGVMGSEVHPGNGHISKKMNTAKFRSHRLFTNF